MRFRKSENLIAHNIICDYTKLAKPIWTEKPARFRSRLSPVMRFFSKRKTRFSATMPKGKNQSFWITDKFDRREWICPKDERGFLVLFLKEY